nr:immunoglobulin light chain junction region [Macaca mulatta]MOY06798.1 immunoglobulin light chain junction region [Macaca mulatta]MOY09068.1 immunoglobulin light chain junction region [Macaca mulatta]MOY09651.1 immunoglobulin light chain junction region [Macaca mulatta]MOY09688.1 immunoglobulin light chain junction region [Macaca mulatta]
DYYCQSFDSRLSVLF